MFKKTNERRTYPSWLTARTGITGNRLGKTFKEMEKVNELKEKLEAHYGNSMLKNCFSLQKVCFTSWEPVHVLVIRLSWKTSMTKTYATVFPKCAT